MWSGYPFWSDSEHNTLIKDGSSYIIFVSNFYGNKVDAEKGMQMWYERFSNNTLYKFRKPNFEST